jgi:excisionase family DNA binding protein
MAEMISISEAAKRVGISRPRLSKLIDDAKLNKKRDGKNMLVDLSAVQTMMQGLASENKIRTPKPTRPKNDQSGIVEHYRDEVRRLSLERDALQEKLKALDAVQNEVKLLKGVEEQSKKTIETLTTQLEIAYAKAEKAEKNPSGLLKKANQIYEVIRGK